MAISRGRVGHEATVTPDPKPATQGAATAAAATVSMARCAPRDLSGVRFVARPSPLATASLKQKMTNTRPRNSRTAGHAVSAPAVRTPPSSCSKPPDSSSVNPPMT